MSAFTLASEVLLRHSDDFEQSRILFAGDLQDDLPARLDTATSRAHTQQFHPLAGVKPPDGGITPVLAFRSPRQMTSQIAIR